MTANRGRKWYQSIDNFNLPGWPLSFYHFKGTQSQEEHKTVHSFFTTIESAWTGRVGLLRSSVSLYSRCTVPRCPRTATVRRATLLYIFLCWPAPIDVDNHQCTATVRCHVAQYSSCTVPTWHRTVAVQCRRCTVQQFYRFMMMKFAPVPDFKIVCMPTQMIVLDLFNQSRLIQLL